MRMPSLRIHCPLDAIHTIADRFHCPRDEINATAGRFHCPTDEIHTMRDRIYLIADHLNSSVDGIDTMLDRIHSTRGRINVMLPRMKVTRRGEDDRPRRASGFGSVDWQLSVVPQHGEHETLRFCGDLDSISPPEAETFQPQPRHSNVRNDLLSIAIRAVRAADGCDDQFALTAIAPSPARTPICWYNEPLFCQLTVLFVLDHDSSPPSKWLRDNVGSKWLRCKGGSQESSTARSGEVWQDCSEAARESRADARRIGRALRGERDVRRVYRAWRQCADTHDRSADRRGIGSSTCGSAQRFLTDTRGPANVLPLSRARPSRAGQTDTSTCEARGASAPGQQTAARRLQRRVRPYYGRRRHNCAIIAT